MYIKGEDNNYSDKVTRQKISIKELCNGDKSLEPIFQFFNKNQNDYLEGKELEKAMDFIQNIGAHSGSEEVIDSDDIYYASIKKAPFKDVNKNTINSAIKNFLQINHDKVQADFDEDLNQFVKENNYETLENNGRIILNKDDKKGFKLAYSKNGNSMLQNIGEKAGRYSESGYYEIYYDIKDNKGNVIIKQGLYNNKNKYVCSRTADVSSNPDLISAYANFREMQKTECPYLYKNEKGVQHHFENGVFRPVDKIIDSDENGYLCQIKRKESQGYVRNFTETIGYYKGKKYNSEGEYYIAKNNLSIDVKKIGNQTTYVSKFNKNRVLTYAGKGQFLLSSEAITAETKKNKVNGELDNPIYQEDIGNCYMVSSNQGISKYFPNLIKEQGIITPQQKTDDILSFSILDEEKNEFDNADQYVVTFPGIDNNSVLGTKKHYTVTKEDLQEAIEANGQKSSMGDPDEIILELGFKKMKTGLIENLIKKYPQFKNNPYRLAQLHNNAIGNEKQYYLSKESIQAYLEGNNSYNDILTAGTEESVLKAMMPKGTEIKTVSIPNDKKASDIIEEYRSKNYMILGAYKVDDSKSNYGIDYHSVLYDNKAKKFISTYDPNTFDTSISTTNDMDNKIKSITVVKIPDKKN